MQRFTTDAGAQTRTQGGKRRRTMLKHTLLLAAVAGLVFALAPAAGAATYTWDEHVSGEWTDQTNWEDEASGYPDAAGDTARVESWVVDPPPLTVNVSDPVTVGILNATDTGDGDSKNVGVDFTASDDGQITFDNNGSGASLLTGRYFGTYNISVPIVMADDLTMQYGFHSDMNVSSTISETGGSYKLTIEDYGKMRNGTWRMYGSSPNTYSGGTFVEINGQVRSDNPKLKLDKDGALGTGDVEVGSAMDGYLWITSSGGDEDRIDNSAALKLIDASIDDGEDTTPYTLRLDADVTETVAELYFDGTQQEAGWWGSTSTTNTDVPAGHQNDTYFSGQGALYVIPEPATLALLGLGAVGTLVARRRRK